MMDNFWMESFMEQESMCVNSTVIKDLLKMGLGMEKEPQSILEVIKFRQEYGRKIDL